MSFLRSVAVLVSGTALGHGITAAALPVLSRLYTPADFSLLAVFAGLASIASVAACLRFDIAVSIPKEEGEALNVAALAIGSALITSIALLALALLLKDWIATITNQPRIASYIWMIPIAVFLAGTYSTLQSWFVRKKDFSIIARSRILQSVSSAGTQLSFGAIGMTPLGLILGNVANSGAACIGLGIKFSKSWGKETSSQMISLNAMKQAFKNHDRFPKYSTFEALSNSAAIQAPMIMIAAMAIGPEAGYLAFAMSVMQAPMALFGTAVGQVYLSQAPEEDRQGNLGRFTTEIFEKLLWTGAGPLIAGGILAPILFAWIFGSQWQRSGWLIAWMTPWFIMQFLAAPISIALHIAGKQKIALALQIFGLIFRVSIVWIADKASLPLGESYASANFAFYLLYLVLILRVVGARRDEVLNGIYRKLPILLIWTGTALGTNHVLANLNL